MSDYEFPNEYPLIAIVWEDHVGSADWKDKADYGKSNYCLVTTIGWLVHKDPKKYVIHNSMVSNEDVSGGESVILRKNITQEWELEVQ